MLKFVLLLLVTRHMQHGMGQLSSFHSKKKKKKSRPRFDDRGMMIHLFHSGMEGMSQHWRLISSGMEKLALVHVSSAFSMWKTAAHAPIIRPMKFEIDTHGGLNLCNFSQMFQQSQQSMWLSLAFRNFSEITDNFLQSDHTWSGRVA
jgi:hypothetical protein